MRYPLALRSMTLHDLELL